VIARLSLVVVSLLGCGRGAREPAPVAKTSAAQTAREGVAMLCASTWNGELEGGPRPRLSWIPDELRRSITNPDVRRVMVALTSPDVQRTAMFDAFLAEHGIAGLVCPFRDRLASWPRDLEAR
jgi:hypothetical protein